MVTHRNASLADILYYRIGGKARFLLEVSSIDDIFEAVAFIRRNKIDKYMVVGLGANLLMPDEDYEGAIIHLKPNDTPDIHLTDDGVVSCFAGETLDALTQFSFSHDLIGLEDLGGLPSTVGGAIRGNAGAFGVDMKAVVMKVNTIDITKDTFEVLEFTTEQCEFSYRNSYFKQNPHLLIIRGFFQLQSATSEEVIRAKKVYQERIDYRKAKHPIEYPSCGSVFKNIREKDKVARIVEVWPDIREQVEKKWYGKVSMGYVVNRLGFTGYEIGGAKITEKHANYICNVDNAKAKDVLKIIEEIKRKFHETFGFYPELEAETVG